jgi:UDP-glucuronate 4-epimerase
MKFLVTGAAGFIGFHLSEQLLTLGNEVIGIDNFSDYYSTDLKKVRLKNLHENINFRFLELDLVENDSFQVLLSNFSPDFVIHLAAQPGVRLSLEESFRYARENLMGFHNCLFASIEAGVKNFLFASSSSVYGNDSSVPYSEFERNLNPISYYGATKLANEVLARSLAQSNEIRIRGLRFFTVYGPWGRPDMAYFKLISSAINGTSFPKFGDGSVKRDFTFVADTVNSIVLLSEELKNRNFHHFDVVNVGGGSPYSLNDLISEVELQTGSKILIENCESIPGDVKLTIADSNELRRLTGQMPTTTLEEGVKRTLAWALRDDVRSNLERWTKKS